ncbi:DNA repair protein RecN [Irregularibacter muris]|uniref:DNA repair protein RecN n=1 Tax=Irregularibacter muris TaxID=1796619 RepID=A0AAE3KZ25_9FIRM|nr:DNA repair protein RecN [Irregularibacter muris]MCR1898006.1 DNA repair protein RecN [Irregularibacter muris]
MLLELNISNFALIDSLKINFNQGLNILTGETGAGKSIIIDALGLILGQRANRESIRQGQKKMIIEALFQVIPHNQSRIQNLLEEKGIDMEEDYTMIMTRELTNNGKSICRINGRIVPVSTMKELGELLVDIHGQHEHQSLLHWETHKELLDSYGGDTIGELSSETKKHYQQYKNVQKSLEELIQDDMYLERQKDIIKFQVVEIEEAKLKESEEELLEERRNLLVNAEKLFQNANQAYELLYGRIDGQASIYDQLSQALDCIEKISTIDSGMKSVLDQLNNAFIQVEDVSFAIRDYNEDMEFNPQELDQIEKRLSTINDLKRKYGGSIEEILLYKQEQQKKLLRIENKNDEIEKLQMNMKKCWQDYITVSQKLSSTRHIIAKQLEDNIIKELRSLGMEKAQFKVNIQTSEKYASDNGIDKIEFLISTNLGQEARPLIKIASGGEISRIMLAFKTILANVDKKETLIFDEVDTGISGRTAQVVAEKMAKIAKTYQVICITHLPQLASMADTHYLIEKKIENNETRTNIYELLTKEQTGELARMLGGAELTTLTLSHAKEMLHMAKQIKSNLK